jgi:hypothetical protein
VRVILERRAHGARTELGESASLENLNPDTTASEVLTRFYGRLPRLTAMKTDRAA